MKIDMRLQIDDRGTYDLMGISAGLSSYKWTYAGPKISASAIPSVFDGGNDSIARESYAKKCLLSKHLKYVANKTSHILLSI